MIVAVAQTGSCFLSAGADCFDRMRPQKPVTNVYTVNVLLHNDVPGQCDVERPIAEPCLVFRFARTGPIAKGSRVIPDLSADRFTDVATLHALCHLVIHTATTQLKSNFDTHLPLGFLPGSHDAFGAMDVRRNRLLTVDMYTGIDGSFEMFGMVPRRTGNHDGVNPGSEEIFVGL